MFTKLPIADIEAGELFIGGSRILISRNYRELVTERVLDKKLRDKTD